MKKEQHTTRLAQSPQKFAGTWIILVLFCWILPKTTLSQSIELQVIGSTGNFHTTTAGSLDFTLGESMIRTTANPDLILPDGFQQQVVWQIVPVEEPSPETSNLQAYPNPMSTWLHVETDRPVIALIYDLFGQVVLPATQLDVSGNLPVYHLPSGVYFLRLSDVGGRPLRTFKLQRFQ